MERVRQITKAQTNSIAAQLTWRRQLHQWACPRCDKPSQTSSEEEHHQNQQSWAVWMPSLDWGKKGRATKGLVTKRQQWKLKQSTKTYRRWPCIVLPNFAGQWSSLQGHSSWSMLIQRALFHIQQQPSQSSQEDGRQGRATGRTWLLVKHLKVKYPLLPISLRTSVIWGPA